MELKNQSNKHIVLSVILIVILGFAAYGSSLNGDFVWDDVGLIKNNEYIKDWSHIDVIFGGDMIVEGKKWNFYRPLQLVTYMIDYSLWQLDVRGYHLTNILLHIAAALCVYWFILELFKNNFLSLLTGALFVVHPVHTEAVAYISGRADSLVLLFMLLCFILYIKSSSSKNFGALILLLLMYTAALLSKEFGMILPVLLLFYHYCFRKALKIKELVLLSIPTLIYFIVRVNISGVLSSDVIYTTTVFERLPGFFMAITNYIRLLLLPFDLHMEYGSKLVSWGNPKVIVGAVILFASLIYSFRKRKSDQLIFFSVAWFYITLLPVSNLFPINAYMAEHWLYIPSIGFFLILAKAIHVGATGWSPLLSKSSYVLVICLLCFYSVLTARQNGYWKDSITFYERTIQYAPDSSKIYNNLGRDYLVEGRMNEAIDAFKKSIEIKPESARAHYNLGNAYKTIGDNEKAITLYKKAIGLKSDYAEAYYNLGVVYMNTQQNEEAISTFKKAIKLKDDYAQTYNNLGGVYVAMERMEEAIPFYKKAVEINPGHANAHYNLGVVYYALNRTEEAIASFNKAIEIKPDDADAYGQLALIYFEQQQYETAVKYYDKATRLGFHHPALSEAIEANR